MNNNESLVDLYSNDIEMLKKSLNWIREKYYEMK